MYYAVIDTNVLVSALLSRANAVSAPAKVVEYLYRGRLVPVYNNEILEEYGEVLSRKKFHFDSSNVKALIGQIKKSVFTQIKFHQEKNSRIWMMPFSLKWPSPTEELMKILIL